MKKMQGLARRLFHDQEGASVVEYGVVLALILAAVIVIIAVLGGKVNDGLVNFDTKFNSASSGP